MGNYILSSNLITSNKKRIIIYSVLCIFYFLPVFSQINTASPSNWLYPNGNPEGTLKQVKKSNAQYIDSLKIKWASSAISGDVQPLVGNIINDEKILSKYMYAPNEITAVVGGKVIILDAKGKIYQNTALPAFVKDISVLIDTNQIIPGTDVVNTVIMGLETIEFENKYDSLGLAYLAGFSSTADTLAILGRLAIKLSDYLPNLFASIKPVFGRKNGSDFSIFSTINMSKPTFPSPAPATPAYLRGFTQFNSSMKDDSYPMPDIGDDLDSRISLAVEVNRGQPSISSLNGNRISCLLPCYSNLTSSWAIDDPVHLVTTYSDTPYLLSVNLNGPTLLYDIYPRSLIDIVPVENTKPYIKPYYTKLEDPNNVAQEYILVTEGYLGIDSSKGIAKIHLYSSSGDPITLYPPPSSIPPITGGENHLWSVGIGNIDGNSSNNWREYYPNYPGDEIVVTQSTKDFDVAGSKLMILRYYTGPDVLKTSPPNTYLFPFDTVATQKIAGWLAAVNDLDNGSDGKDEILLVDGSTLRILRMKNYSEVEFRSGRPFDTVAEFSFPTQTISSVVVADLEGDGLNDIIVTTYDSTYVIGSLLVDILDVIEPTIQQTPPTQYCAGDSILIRWVNKMKGYDYVDIYFKPLWDEFLKDTLITIDQGFPNLTDTVNYYYVASNKVFGLNGNFIVKSAAYPDKINDSTAIVEFSIPKITLDANQAQICRVGEEIIIRGSSLCLDSVALEFSIDSTTWNRMNEIAIFSDNSFSLVDTIPCILCFNCTPPDSAEYLLFRVIGYKSEFVDTTAIIPVKLLPANLPISFDTCTTNCPTKYFKWNINDLDYQCDTILVSLSVDNGKTFQVIAELDSKKESYEWNIPRNIPDSVLIRFCCKNSCARIDTMLRSIHAKYISTVSPNPFNPTIEDVEIVYSIPDDLNVTIRVYDQANRLVAEPVINQSRKSNVTYCDRWNGKIWNGSNAQNGVYYLSLELSNGVKEVYPVFVRK